MSKRPTMSDIARACGVSQATVSLVLSNAPGTRVSAATREAVRARAEAVGYRRPHPGPERRPVLAMLINESTSSPHVGGLVDGVAEAAIEHGLLPLALPTGGDEAAEAAAIAMLDGLPVAGVIYARLITQAVKPPPALGRWPTILLNCHALGDPHPSVMPGDLGAGATATLHLLDAGHRRVAFIGGDPVIEASRERLRGFRRALAMRDLPDDPALVVKGGWTVSGGRDGLRRLLGLRDPPTAVFCFCDRTALGVYAAAAAAGLRIARDLSVVGFDNEDFAADLDPPLTTMELPHADMARHAVEVLAQLIGAPGGLTGGASAGPPGGALGAGSPHRRVKFDCPLVRRASVGPAAPAPRPGLAAAHAAPGGRAG